MQRPQRSEDERCGRRQGPAHARRLREETPAPAKRKEPVSPPSQLPACSDTLEAAKGRSDAVAVMADPRVTPTLTWHRPFAPSQPERRQMTRQRSHRSTWARGLIAASRQHRPCPDPLSAGQQSRRR
jgi:hypothetical protein